MIFARKISKGKWEKALEACPEDENGVDNFPADTLSLDLCAKKNELSIWVVESCDALEDVVLALMGNESSHIERIYILYVDNLSDFELKENPGNTKIESLKNNHRDIISLNYKKMGELAKLFLDAYRNNKYKSFSESKVKNIIRRAIENDRVSKEDFNSSIVEKLQL